MLGKRWISLKFRFIKIYFNRRIVFVNISSNNGIIENCTFQSFKLEYKTRRKFFVTTFLPLTKKGFVYKFRHDGNPSEQQHLDIEWFLRQKLIEYGAEKPVILRFLNNLKRLVHWREHHDIRSDVNMYMYKCICIFICITKTMKCLIQC